MKASRIKGTGVLMALAILVITGFQVFWLIQNFRSEKDTMEVKAGIGFRESVFNLQAGQLSSRLGGQARVHDSINVIVKNDGPAIKVTRDNSREVVSMVNIVGKEVNDSSRGDTAKKPAAVFYMTSSGTHPLLKDSLKEIRTETEFPGNGGNRFVQLLYGIDSARDTIRIADITRETRAALMKEGINVPFNVVKKERASMQEANSPFSAVTVGLKNPLTYTIEIGNSYPYLLKKLWPAVLFSVFLVGITIASFVVLYRGLIQQQRLALLKNEFISNMTHELKTPIATVTVALEALKNFHALNDTQRSQEYLDISSQEMQRLSLLVDKVLRISMFENRDVELRKEEFDLLTLIREVEMSMRVQFEKRKAKVRVMPEGTSFNIRADRLHIMSVIYNLFDNALKYCVRVPEIAVTVRDRGKDLEIEFRDNGIGIPPEYREKVFEKFFRVPRGNTHDVKGYGLGLSYVAHIIDRHGGSIRVEGTEGEGSHFIIQLPKQHG